MKAVYLRPLASFCLTFFIFAVVGGYLGREKLLISAAFAFLALLFFVITVVTKNKRHIRMVSILTLAVSLGMLFTSFTIDARAASVQKHFGEHQIVAKVESVEWKSSYSGSFIAKIRELDGEKVSFSVAFSSDMELERGDIISGKMKLGDPDERSRSYYKSRNVFAAAEETELDYKGTELDFTDKLNIINSRLSARLILFMGEEDGGINASLLLNNKTWMPEKFDVAVRNLGISHLIALSGMHLTVICGLFNLFISRLGAKGKRIAIIPIVIFYVLLTGFCASIVRAGFMLIVLNLIALTGRPSDSPTDLGTTLLIITLVDPTSIFDIGLQLSATAMLGIYATSKVMKRDVFKEDEIKSKLKSTVDNLIAAVAVGIFTAVFTIPLTSLYFGSFTPISILATLIFTLPSSAMLWLSPFVILFGNVPIIGNIICFLCIICTRFFKGGSIYMGFSNSFSIPVRSIVAVTLLFAAVLFVGIILVLDSKKGKMISCSICLALITVFASVNVYTNMQYANQTVLIPQCTSSYDGFIIKGENTVCAVDISRGSATLYKLMADAADKLYVRAIDKLIITDPHRAHINALLTLTDRLDLSAVYLPDCEESRNLGNQIADVKIEYYQWGEEFKLDSYTIKTYDDVYIDRSVVPIIRIGIKTDNNYLFYMGSAAMESGLFPEDCDYLWLGGYGPKYKLEIDMRLFTKNLILSQKAISFCLFNSAYSTDRTFILG